MIQLIAKECVPDANGRPPSPMRLFAQATVEDFMRSSRPGDVFEVSGWPMPEGASEVEAATRARQELGAATAKRDRRCEVKVSRRGARVFMERLKAWVPPKPYPER